MMNVDKICEELIWYGAKDKNTGKFSIFIALDFDYTLTKASSWLSGTFIENDGCFDILKRWRDEFGCKYILDTMRTGYTLKSAIGYCNGKGLDFFGIGKNPLQDADGEITNKCWAVFSIDDRNVMTPLICPDDGRPYVNWEILEMYLTPILRKIHDRLPEMEEGVLKKKREVENNDKKQ